MESDGTDERSRVFLRLRNLGRSTNCSWWEREKKNSSLIDVRSVPSRKVELIRGSRPWKSQLHTPERLFAGCGTKRDPGKSWQKGPRHGFAEQAGNRNKEVVKEGWRSIFWGASIARNARIIPSETAKTKSWPGVRAKLMLAACHDKGEREREREKEKGEKKRVL